MAAMGDGGPFSGGPTEEAYDIRIARDGTWLHEGRPIARPELVRLFASILRRDDAGEYWLVTPVERGRIVVEDAPFLAVELSASGSGHDRVLYFRTNIDEWVEAGPEHPIVITHDPVTGEPRPYIDIRNGLTARILRPVYYELAEMSAPDGPHGEDEVGIWSRNAFFALGRPPGD